MKYGLFYPPKRKDGSEIQATCPWAMGEDLQPLLFDTIEEIKDYSGPIIQPKYALEHDISPEVREFTGGC